MSTSQMEAVVRSVLRSMGYSTTDALELATKVANAAPADPVYVCAEDKVEALESFTKFYVAHV